MIKQTSLQKGTHPLKVGFELSPFFGRKRQKDFVGERAQGRDGLLVFRLSLFGQLQLDATPVLGLRNPSDEVSSLELVRDLGRVGLRELQALSEVPQRQSLSALFELMEDRESCAGQFHQLQRCVRLRRRQLPHSHEASQKSPLSL